MDFGPSNVVEAVLSFVADVLVIQQQAHSTNGQVLTTFLLLEQAIHLALDWRSRGAVDRFR